MFLFDINIFDIFNKFYLKYLLANIKFFKRTLNIKILKFDNSLSKIRKGYGVFQKNDHSTKKCEYFCNLIPETVRFFKYKFSRNLFLANSTLF